MSRTPMDLFHDRPRRPAHPVLVALRSVLFLIVLLLLALLLISTVRGLPKPIEKRILARINEGPFFLRVERLQLHPTRGVFAVNAAVYRKGIVGPSLFEADEIHFDLAPTALLKERWRFIEACTVVNGVFRRDPGGARREVRAGRARIHVTLQNSWIEGVYVEEARGWYELEGTVASIRDASGIAGEGEQSGTFRMQFETDRASRDFRMEGECLANPYIMVPLLQGRQATNLVAAIRRFSFHKHPPQTRLTMEGCMANGARYTNVEMDFSMQDGSYRGVPITHMDVTARSRFTPTNGVTVFSPVRIMCGERTLLGDVTVERESGRTSFRGVSSVHPYQVAAMISPALERVAQRFRFGSRTEVTVRGEVYRDDLDRTDIHMTGNGTGLASGRILLDTYDFDMNLNGRTCQVSRIQGTLWGGTVKGWGYVRPDGVGTGRTLQVQAEARDMQFSDFARDMMRASGPGFSGRLSMKGDLIGPLTTNWLASANGRMRIDVSDGTLFKVPLFGGLTKTLAKAIPGMNSLVQQTGAGATVSLLNGRAHTDDIVVKGDTLLIEGDGDFTFPDKLDFTMKLTLPRKSIAQRIIRLPLDVLNEVFFEIRLTGTPKKPKWFLRRFSRELFEKFGIRLGENTDAKKDREEQDGP